MAMVVDMSPLPGCRRCFARFTRLTRLLVLPARPAPVLFLPPSASAMPGRRGPAAAFAMACNLHFALAHPAADPRVLRHRTARWLARCRPTLYKYRRAGRPAAPRMENEP